MVSADVTLDSIFHPPCSSERYGDQSLAIATAAPSARYLRHTEEHSHHGYLLFLHDIMKGVAWKKQVMLDSFDYDDAAANLWRRG